jgi:hypothetical protein
LERVDLHAVLPEHPDFSTPDECVLVSTLSNTFPVYAPRRRHISATRDSLFDSAMFYCCSSGEGGAMQNLNGYL